jgi:hypothetical protein
MVLKNYLTIEDLLGLEILKMMERTINGLIYQEVKDCLQQIETQME